MLLKLLSTINFETLCIFHLKYQMFSKKFHFINTAVTKKLNKPKKEIYLNLIVQEAIYNYYTIAFMYMT